MRDLVGWLVGWLVGVLVLAQLSSQLLLMSLFSFFLSVGWFGDLFVLGFGLAVGWLVGFADCLD